MRHLNHLFIVNPAAGKGIAATLHKRIQELFEKIRERYPDTTYEIVLTQYPGHATEIARDYSARATYRIYAVGGDGTINEVLNGMADSDSSLACIPGGTGNDFVQYISGDFRRDEILRETILGEEELIDVGMVNEKYFLNVASAGFDAKVNYKAGLFKGKPLIGPTAAYYGGILASLADLSPIHVRIHEGDTTREKDLFMLTVANGQIYGGGYHIAPEASITDGLFDVIEVEPMTIPKILKYMPMLKKGTHLGQPGISFFRTDRIQITSDEEFYVNIDGETIRSRDVDFRLRARKIRMVFPRAVTRRFELDEI